MSKTEYVTIVFKRPRHIQRECYLYNRGQYRKPENKKTGKLGLCL